MKDVQDGEVRIFVGEENPLQEAQNYSMIVSPYQRSDGEKGLLAIIGPKRMRYEQNKGLIEFMRRALGGQKYLTSLLLVINLFKNYKIKDMSKKENISKFAKTILTVKAVIVNSQNEILLLKRSNKILNPGKWDLPGGTLEKAETLEEALTREIQEETGLKIEVADILGTAEFAKETNNLKMKNVD